MPYNVFTARGTPAPYSSPFTKNYGSPFGGSLQPGAGPAPVLPGSGQYGSETPGFCSLITNPQARAACELANQFIFRRGRGAGGGTSATNLAACPPGYEMQADGSCKTTGLGRYLPGDVGMPDTGWTPVNGRYGAGVTPLPVEGVRLHCPSGYKLGKDNVCYECLKRKERKWDPGTRPLFTGGDVNAIARVRRLNKKRQRINALFPAPSTRKARKGRSRK